MKKVSFVVSKYLQNNEMFDEYSHLNRDNIFSPFVKLKNEFKKYGYTISTNDITSIDEADIVIYFNMPKVLVNEKDIFKSYLILSESELIRSDNYDKLKHKYFNKIFTWHDGLVDDTKYFKLNFSHLFPREINKNLAKKEKLCILIAGNKNSPVKDKRELYSKRKQAIRWFEKYSIEDFDLYGIGWEKYQFSGLKIIRAFNRIPLIGKLYAHMTNQSYPSYKGKVDNKKEVMEKYKFSICYENARDIPGYITEKMFDSFFAGCVPIYWGADNITDYIPKECFIDKKDFNTYEILYDHIRKLSDKDYLMYLNNIEEYLKSEKSYIFSDEYYSKKIVTTIIGKESE